jgi:hypothetical protein
MKVEAAKRQNFAVFRKLAAGNSTPTHLLSPFHLPLS